MSVADRKWTGFKLLKLHVSSIDYALTATASEGERVMNSTYINRLFTTFVILAMLYLMGHGIVALVNGAFAIN